MRARCYNVSIKRFLNQDVVTSNAILSTEAVVPLLGSGSSSGLRYDLQMFAESGSKTIAVIKPFWKKHLNRLHRLSLW